MQNGGWDENEAGYWFAFCWNGERMRPRRKMLIYCRDLTEANRVAFILRLKIHAECYVLEHFQQALDYDEAELLLLISQDHSVRDYQDLVDAYVHCPALVWRTYKGATMIEVMEAVKQMLVRKRGPKPQPQTPAALTA